MAEYTNGGIFGDSALFDEFESVPLNEPPVDQPVREEETAQKSLEKKLAKLEQENERLKSLLKNLVPPRGLHVQNTESGPVAHVIFMNNDLSRKYRQEAEEFFEKLVARGESTDSYQSGMIDIDDDDDNTNVKPQRSSRVIIDEGSEIKKEAFLSTGNVQYYHVFCVDQLGRPLINGDAQLTGWHIPSYSSVFLEALPIDDNPQGGKKARRPKNKCWNCDSEDHSLRECPLQRDMARINANRQLFQSMSTPAQKRYVKDAKERGRESKDEDRFSTFEPGVISDELRQAMGIRDDQLPPYIYMMRRHGYPPGWQREAEVESSGMRVYDIKTNEEGEIDDSGDQNEDKPKYDITKLVDYPGYNVPLPEGVKDEWREFGAMPMQAEQRKELQELYMTPPDKGQERGQKRRGSFMNSREVKKAKSKRNELDMEMETAEEDNPSSGSCRGWFADDEGNRQVFKPPLPPTPGTASPLPPLPLSTPPDTPDQTPPHPSQQTPTHDSDYTPMPSPGSSAPLGLSAAASQESSRSTSPTVEELELQQRQLMEALMDAGASSMASDTDGTSEVLAESVEEEEDTQDVEDTQRTEDTPQDDLKPPGVESGEILESPESPDQDANPVNNTVPEESRTTNIDEDVPRTSFKIQNPPELHKDLSGDSTPNKSGVPRLSNFASGITPHEVEGLAESTGVFQKLLGILRNKGSKTK